MRRTFVLMFVGSLLCISSQAYSMTCAEEFRDQWRMHAAGMTLSSLGIAPLFFSYMFISEIDEKRQLSNLLKGATKVFHDTQLNSRSVNRLYDSLIIKNPLTTVSKNEFIETLHALNTEPALRILCFKLGLTPKYLGPQGTVDIADLFGSESSFGKFKDTIQKYRVAAAIRQSKTLKASVNTSEVEAPWH